MNAATRPRTVSPGTGAMAPALAVRAQVLDAHMLGCRPDADRLDHSSIRLAREVSPDSSSGFAGERTVGRWSSFVRPSTRPRSRGHGAGDFAHSQVSPPLPSSAFCHSHCSALQRPGHRAFSWGNHGRACTRPGRGHAVVGPDGDRVQAMPAWGLPSACHIAGVQHTREGE